MVNAEKKNKEQYSLEVGEEICCMGQMKPVCRNYTFCYGGYENGKHIVYIEENNERYFFDKLPTKKDCYEIWVSDYYVD